MAYAIGCALAFFVTLFARIVGFDRDQAFYPTVVIVVASYYVLFAVIGGTSHTVIAETAVMLIFLSLAVLGFRWNLWMAVAGLVGHGVFDIFHGMMIANSGVPQWWPAFCMAYDVSAGCCLAWLLARSGEQRLVSRGR